MKNLSLWEVSVRNLNLDSEENLTVCSGHNEDSSCNEVFVCTHNLNVVNFNESGELKWSKDLSDIVTPNNSPVNITLLTLTNALCVGLANGELISISDGGNICDITGTCDNGLLVCCAFTSSSKIKRTYFFFYSRYL